MASFGEKEMEKKAKWVEKSSSPNKKNTALQLIGQKYPCVS